MLEGLATPIAHIVEPTFTAMSARGATTSMAAERVGLARGESTGTASVLRPSESSTSQPGIRVAQSDADDAAVAVRALQRLLYQPYGELVIFFCSNDYDLEAVAREMNSCFAGMKVIGCTSAGGIGPRGYVEHSISGISFTSKVLSAAVGRIASLSDFDPDAAEALVASLRERLEGAHPGVHDHSLFAFQMIDGLAQCEEAVTYAFQDALGLIPLVGASAGDTGPFGPTYVFEHGTFHEDSAVLLIATSTLPFRTFSTHHLTGTDRRAVVTAAGPSSRRVVEIDGFSAAEGYARLFDRSADELGTSFFAAHPVVVRIGGVDYGRAVSSVNNDGSLTFQCAMEEGVILRGAVENDLVTDFMNSFAPVNRYLGKPSAIVMFDSVPRNESIAQLDLEARVAGMLRSQNTVGFSTHGVQAKGIHLNQAVAGVAFGRQGAR